MVADVHRLFRARITQAQGLLEWMRIRFADAQILSAQGELEVVRQAQAAHIRIAVGDHAEGVVIGQEFQGGLHVGEDLYLVTSIEEHRNACSARPFASSAG